jgi:hypothetical protein
MSTTLITVLDQSKREDTLRIRGFTNLSYTFNWTRVGSRSFYAYKPESQRETDDMFHKRAYHRVRLGVFSEAGEPQAVKTPSYDKATKADLMESCDKLGLYCNEKDNNKVLRRVLDAYWQGVTHG